MQHREGLHAALELAPSTAEYVPAGHSAHWLRLVVLVRFEYVPAPHGTHAPMLAAPGSDEYVPAGHAAHASLCCD